MNEHDIERQLQQQSLVQPSANLNQRMESLFERAISEIVRTSRPAVPIWLTAAACLICGIAGFGVRSLFISRENRPAIVYVFPPSEAMTHFLNGVTTGRNNDFDFVHARVQVLQPPASQGNQL